LFCAWRQRRYRDEFMATRRHKAPQPIGAAMQPLLDRLDREGHFAIVRLAKAWPDIVGEAIARRTEIASLKFHTAVVKVSGAMWIQELNLMKSQILERVRERVGDDAVRELRFVQGRLSRRERPKLRTVPRATRKSIELPELKDPELRAAFERLIEAWGRAPR
jgi:predicted nucleic acid-binding Zn ribbon protein